MKQSHKITSGHASKNGMITCRSVQLPMETALYGITHVDTVVSLTSSVLKLASLFDSHKSYAPPTYAWAVYTVLSFQVLGITTYTGTGWHFTITLILRDTVNPTR